MRKHVTFVEQKHEKLLKNGSGSISMRFAEFNKKCSTDGFGLKPGQQVREMCRRSQVSGGSQHTKNVNFPTSFMSAPFLQHPALTAGQRRRLHNIANVYSTERMRRQMKQHFLKVLHACVQSGQNPGCRWGYGEHQAGVFSKDAEKVVAGMKRQGQRGSSSNSVSSSITPNTEVILPKIANR